MPPLSKREKQIKSLAKDKRKKNQNFTVPLENSDIDDNLEWKNEEEVIWRDDEKRAQAKKLLAKNGQPITNFFNPFQLQPHALNDPNKSDQKSNQSDNQESEHEDHCEYGQLIKSVEKELKQSNLDGGYKLRLIALLQYLMLVNHKEPKIKASLCIARQLNKGSYFARCLRVWEKLIRNGETIPISKWEKHCKIQSLLNDKDIQIQIVTYLRENKFEFYMADFIDYIKNIVFRHLELNRKQQ
ncbi:5785_t:CDS:2 [Funneliformis caledonium]|uniref:5785_t:CDS:1 n=1 Tax=Funneliformis caledonium TaxID=1117310 RepID=A0A9N9CW78_9GLOM|nr:5785_t:CDS:2 [Funneliformis caledonium]